MFPSADYLVDEVEELAAQVLTVHSPRAAAAVRRAVAELFQVRRPSTGMCSCSCSRSCSHSCASVGRDVCERAGGRARVELLARQACSRVQACALHGEV